MTITTRCPTCGEPFQAESEQLGRLVTCDNCGGPVRIAAQARPSSRRPPAPPPPAPEGPWYYRVLGEEFGPLSFVDLQRCARERRLGPDNEVRLGSGGRWVLAERIAWLFDDPAPASSEWFYTQGGRRFGPVDLETVRRLVRSGALLPDERVREAGWPKDVRVKRWVASGFSVARPLREVAPAAGPAPEVPIDPVSTPTGSTPPPPPRAEWFYLDKGQRVGPLPLQSVQALVRAGHLLPHDLVWKAGMDGWQAVGSLRELEPGQGAAPGPGSPLGTRP